MICAAAVTAQFVGGKATRDALYLANLDVTSLPMMIVATSIFSIAMVAVASKLLGAASPATFVPLAFVSSAVLLLVGWGLLYAVPRVGAVVIYLQISGIGPLLGSGFWLIVTECFDPRTAKRRFGEIAGAGTFGGLLGGLFAERVGAISGAAAMLPALAVMNLLCAWQIRSLARALPVARAIPVSALDFEAPPTRSGLRVLREAPYLRSLAALVVLGTIAAALVDYVFKVQAVSTFGRGDALLRFFAVYYAAISLITFAVQTSGSRIALEKLGLAVTTGTPSLALLLTGIASSGRARSPEHDGRPRRRIDLPRLALPRRVRALLYADRGRGEARRQVDHRRWHGPPRRRGGRWRHSTADRRPAGRTTAAGHHLWLHPVFSSRPGGLRAASIGDTCKRWSAAC